jgi:HD-GYP domain-containing protein (c-di-GMP phosphodiesterase class II)
MASNFERQQFPPRAGQAATARRTESRTDLIFVGASPAERNFLDVVRQWGQSIEFGDNYFRGHCSRVAEHAAALATELQVDPGTRMTILVGAHLHGLGRMRMPRTLRTKAGTLTPHERAAIREIPVWGTEILSKIKLPWDVAPIVRWHNEHADGSGYPDGLRGDEIPLAAQIVGIANVFDAMTSQRPHRPALRPSMAVRALAQVREWWSAEVFQAYLTRLQAIYAGSLCLA